MGTFLSKTMSQLYDVLKQKGKDCHQIPKCIKQMKTTRHHESWSPLHILCTLFAYIFFVFFCISRVFQPRREFKSQAFGSSALSWAPDGRLLAAGAFGAVWRPEFSVRMQSDASLALKVGEALEFDCTATNKTQLEKIGRHVTK